MNFLMIVTSLLISKAICIEASEPSDNFERVKEKSQQIDYPTPTIKSLKKFWRTEISSEDWTCESLHLDECKKEKRHVTTLLPSPFG